MGNISSIHDTFIRAIMTDRRIALDYFQASLPASVHGKLDFSTLAPLPDTYVSAELRKTVSDIVYSCQRSTVAGVVGGRFRELTEGFIVYLFEQSKLGENKILKIMETLPSTVRKTIESAVDYWREEGRHEGEQKKTEKAVRNMLGEGLPIELICKVQEVTPDYVTRIRKQIQTGK